MATPADVGFAVFQGLLCFRTLTHFQFVQFRFQLLHRRVLVFVLRAVILALHDNAGGIVGDANGGFGAVDMLAASAGSTVHVYAQIGGVDVDGDVVVDFRRDEHRGERRMAAVAGVERRFADQTVHARFGTQPTERIVAFKTDGCAFNAGDIAVGFFDQFGFKTTAFAPTQIHAFDHRGPVLRLGAAGTGLDVKEGVVSVHFPGEHAPEFQVGDLLFKTIQIAGNRIDGIGIVFFDRHGQEFIGIIQSLLQMVKGIDHRFQLPAFLAQGLGLFGLVPDFWVFQFPQDFN